MDQFKIRSASARTRLLRLAPSVIPVILSALLLWFGFFVAGPWFLRNPPGPNNPSFAWYLLFHSFPVTLLTAAFFRLKGGP
jgi:hypothetical protein